MSQKNGNLFIIAIILSAVNQLSQFLADVYYRKSATRRCTVIHVYISQQEDVQLYMYIYLKRFVQLQYLLLTVSI